MNVDPALLREWLETNGLGGFASSTLAGLNTRRYHGLLTAATQPPVGCIVLLSKLEETAIIGDQRFELSTNRYPGAIHPPGFEYLYNFDIDPFPTFTWIVEGISIRKTIFMVHGQNTTVIQYHVDGPVRLELRPLIAFRDCHSLTRANGALDATVVQGERSIMLRPYSDLPALYLAHDAAQVMSSGSWYYNLEYDAERERGLVFQEDLFNSCVLCFDGSATVIASIEPANVSSASA
jgi:predicted glycogen debranching enzyme